MFAMQRLFVQVTLDRDPCDVAGIFNQLEFLGAGTSRFTVVDGKSAEGLPFACKQWPGPNGTNSIRQHPVAIKLPSGVGDDVGHVDGLLSINGRAAGATLWTNCHDARLVDKAGKTRRRSAIELLSVLVRKPNRAGQTF